MAGSSNLASDVKRLQESAYSQLQCSLMFEAKKLAVQYHPPSITLEYLDKQTRKLRHRTLYIGRMIKAPLGVGDQRANKILQQIYSYHHAYFHAVPSAKVS